MRDGQTTDARAGMVPHVTITRCVPARCPVLYLLLFFFFFPPLLFVFSLFSYFFFSFLLIRDRPSCGNPHASPIEPAGLRRVAAPRRRGRRPRRKTGRKRAWDADLNRPPRSRWRDQPADEHQTSSPRYSRASPHAGQPRTANGARHPNETRVVSSASRGPTSSVIELGAGGGGHRAARAVLAKPGSTTVVGDHEGRGQARP